VKVPIRLKPAAAAAVAAAAVTVVVAALATPAFASTTKATSSGYSGASHAVFVQTDATSGNHVVAYHRAADGALSPAGCSADRWSTTRRRRAR
jgi:hypothetical protein